MLQKFDGLVKSPTSGLCCISQSFNVRKVRLMITKFARLEFELFTKPSKSDFLRVNQGLVSIKNVIFYILLKTRIVVNRLWQY
jgi:hypothetical protein